jgi:hypothetical protein
MRELAPRPVTRSDFTSLAPRSYVRSIEERARAANLDPRRLAASRLIWRLALDGHACVGDNAGNERTYAARSAWFPKLKWPARPPTALHAASGLARRYLAVQGPATATDVGHFFGARVSNARRWLEVIADDLVPVTCGGRKGLIALAEDEMDLRSGPPGTSTAWPLRLLPLWESMMMGHADKSWTVPDERERKVVWRKAAYVAAVVIARGRVVATWSQKKRGRRLEIQVEPLGRWRERTHAASVRRDARAIAAHQGLDDVEVASGG